MSIALALILAATEDPAIAEEHARAVAMALLDPNGPTSLPYAGPAIRYKTLTPENITYTVPTVQKSPAGFRKALRGCTIDQVRFYGEIGLRPHAHSDVSVTFKCPDDFAHARDALFLHLTVAGGIFHMAELQVGIASTGSVAPAPPMRPPTMVR